MLNGKVSIIFLTIRLIKNHCINEWTFFPKPKPSQEDVKV